MEIEKFEADIKFVKSKIEEADEMMERMRADLEERKEEGDANEVGLLKAALFDVMEAQEERRKVIATIKKRVTELRACPTQTSPSMHKPISPEWDEDKKSVVDSFCPILEKSLKEAQSKRSMRKQSEMFLFEDDLKVKTDVRERKVNSAEDQNRTKIKSLEEEVALLTEELKLSRERPASMTKQSTVVREIKPHRYKTGGDICTFLERFQQYVCINNIRNNNLDMLMMSLIDDDKMYKKLRNIQYTPHQCANIISLIHVVKDNIFPITETRILRSELSRLKQNPEESVEDFAIRIEDLAEKAYMDLHLRGEACLSRLMEGAKSEIVRRKLMESDFKDFESAKLMAVKQERIAEMISTQDAKLLNDFEAPVYKMEAVKGIESSLTGAIEGRNGNVESRMGSVDSCSKCGRKGHGEETCWKDVTCQLCGVSGHVASVCKSAGPVNSAQTESGNRSVTCYDVITIQISCRGIESIFMTCFESSGPI